MAICKPFFAIALTCLSLVFSHQARAADGCSTSGAPSLPGTVSTIGLNVIRDMPIGQVIPGSRVAINWTMNCSTSSVIAAGKYWNVTFTSQVTAVADMTGIYTSASMPPGLGFRVLDASNNPIAAFSNGTDFQMDAAPSGLTQYRLSGAVELVKIAASLGTSSLSPRLEFYVSVPGEVWANGDSDSTDGANQSKSTLALSYTISNPSVSTCTVTNKTQSVTLPTVPQSALRGANIAAGSTPFTISLQCQKGSHIYMLMTDVNNPTGTLNLLFPKDKIYGIAAVKITKSDGTRVEFGPDSSSAGATNQWFVGDSPDGTFNIPLIASYQTYSTDNAVAFPVGAVQVAATFTLSYQ